MTHRLFIVSNRLPVVVNRDGSGRVNVERGAGGLVTALRPVIRRHPSVWFGWPGCEGDGEVREVVRQHGVDAGYDLHSIDLTPTEVNLYYNGFSNEVLWPLFHDFIWLCNFDPDYWPAYESVNAKFAAAVAAQIQPDDVVWVHDYQLLLVGAKLRELEIPHRVGFFLHIPFPSVDGFSKIPWRAELLAGLLRFDLIGFQTDHDVRNFVRCVQTLIPAAKVHKAGRRIRLNILQRNVIVGAFPISIDYDRFAKRSRDDDVVQQAAVIRHHLGDQQLVLGIDRLDYTKGIPRRLKAFAEVLTAYPELRRRITLLQVIVPSRTDVLRYQALKEDIERLIGEINGRFTQPGWIPIQYMYRTLCETELLAYFHSADIALITPLKDGMNLVAKEYCVANAAGTGVLILSEFAGAAAQLSTEAVIVNPFDKKMTAAAIHHAFEMATADRVRRMQNLRRLVRRDNVFKWADDFLAELRATAARDSVTHAARAID
ncbi:trehalose-6-phosphate synthase [candidate division KSB1 bacterium]|nr:trehalose-6-phosphate synthase [candidate division KSB1 bacterium]